MWALRDKHGPWCAWCLNYFSPDLLEPDRQAWRSRFPDATPPGQRPEKHHVIARRDRLGRLIGVLGGDPPSLEVKFSNTWTVDVHERCHRLNNDAGNIQPIADNGATNLEYLLRRAQAITEDSPERDFQLLDDHVLKAFESGRYSVALFLNEAVRVARLKRGEPESAIETLRYQLSARAGIRNKSPLDLDSFSDGLGAADIPSLLHVASHQSNVGYFEDAKATLERAREAAQARGGAFDLDLALRSAQIGRSLTSARQAVRIAENEGISYRQNTAMVLAGFIALAQQSGDSQAYFEAVLASDGPSWLYRAECWFGLGCLAVKSRQPSVAYRYLAASQYVYGVLGLQPLSHVGLQFPGAESSSLPIHLLFGDRLAGLSRARCLELRLSAIEGGSIRTRLMEDIGGLPSVSDSPDPLRA